MNRLNPFDWNYYFGDFYSFPKTTITTKISFKATKTEYQLEVHLAGKKKEDVEITVGGFISVKAEEYSTALFRLYDDMQLSSAVATMEHGLLKITIPRQSKVPTIKIPIS
mgnify:CR=1 FL=1